MKFAVLIVLVVASWASAAPRQVDWAAVSTKIGEVEALTTATYTNLTRLVFDEAGDTSCRNQMFAILGNANNDISALIGEFDSEIAAQTLTYEMAQAHFAVLREISAETYGALAEFFDTFCINEATLEKIQGIFTGVQTDVEVVAFEVYALLGH